MKTNLDLFLSAQTTAHSLLENHSKHALHSAALKAFNDEGHDPLDWDYWFQAFEQQRQYLIGLRSQKTASQIAGDRAKAAAATEEATRAATAPKPAPAAPRQPAPESIMAQAVPATPVTDKLAAANNNPT